MSDVLFGRAASIVLRAQGREDRLLDGLRLSFQIEKTDERTPNAAKISVWNLSETSRNYLKDPQGQRTQILLSVGYVGGGQGSAVLRTVFFGDVTRASTSKSSGNLITEIECGDGQRAFNQAKINESFAPGVKVKRIFENLASKLGVGLGEIAELDESQYVNGYSSSGLVRDELDVITNKLGKTWSIQNGNLQVLPIGQANSQSVVVLSPDSGLIGTPNQKDDGIEFMSLLQPELVPGRRVQIESKYIQGTFRVTRVSMQGDTRNGPWFSKCEAV